MKRMRTTTLVYCPSPVCRGHRFTEAQLGAERRALRPYTLTPDRRARRYTDAETCFRDHDAQRAARG